MTMYISAYLVPPPSPQDCSYLDYGASEPSSRLGIDRAAELTPGVSFPAFNSYQY